MVCELDYGRFCMQTDILLLQTCRKLLTSEPGKLASSARWSLRPPVLHDVWIEDSGEATMLSDSIKCSLRGGCGADLRLLVPIFPVIRDS